MRLFTQNITYPQLLRISSNLPLYTSSHSGWIFVAFLFIATTVGCASTSKMDAQQPVESSEMESAQVTSPTSNSPDDKELAELEALYQERLKSARMRFIQADVDFMVGMISHHAQALIMSDLAPGQGASQSVQTLASRIINAQKDEIATMQKWLRDRDQAVPEVHIEGLNLMIHGMGNDHSGHHMHHDMPGMLTQDQLEELAQAEGTEFDRLFLTYMIQHHEGAVTMVHDLFATDGAGQDEAAFKLASDIQVDQITEINRMKLMLSSIPGAEDN